MEAQKVWSWSSLRYCIIKILIIKNKQANQKINNTAQYLFVYFFRSYTWATGPKAAAALTCIINRPSKKDLMVYWRSDRDKVMKKRIRNSVSS